MSSDPLYEQAQEIMRSRAPVHDPLFANGDFVRREGDTSDDSPGVGIIQGVTAFADDGPDPRYCVRWVNDRRSRGGACGTYGANQLRKT